MTARELIETLVGLLLLAVGLVLITAHHLIGGVLALAGAILLGTIWPL